MKVTKMEEVTRTYCDVCKKDITASNRLSKCDNDGNPIDLCMSYVPKGELSCEQKFMFKKKYISGDVDFK